MTTAARACLGLLVLGAFSVACATETENDDGDDDVADTAEALSSDARFGERHSAGSAPLPAGVASSEHNVEISCRGSAASWRLDCELPNPIRSHHDTKDGDYWVPNRIWTNPDPHHWVELDEPGAHLWVVTDRSAPIYDAVGNVIANLDTSAVKIQYGLRRKMRVAGAAAAADYVYAFAALARGGVRVSGWLREETLGKNLYWGRAYSGHVPMETVEGEPRELLAHRHHVSTAHPASLVGRSVTCNSKAEHASEEALDYFADEMHHVRLLYSLPGLGGVASDNLPAGVEFRRAKGVSSLFVHVYKDRTKPCDAANEVESQALRFVYGAAVLPSGEKRFGWIAYDALAH